MSLRDEALRQVGDFPVEVAHLLLQLGDSLK